LSVEGDSEKGNNMSPFGFGRECVLAFEFDLSKFHAYSVYDGHLLMIATVDNFVDNIYIYVHRHQFL
jgi:uncharacterized protein YuzB (UPF0349 family)